MDPQFRVYRDGGSTDGPSYFNFDLSDSGDDDLPGRDTSKTYVFKNVPANMKVDLNRIRVVATNTNGWCLKALAIKQGSRTKKYMKLRTGQSFGLWLGRDWRRSTEDNESHRWYLYGNRYATKIP